MASRLRNVLSVLFLITLLGDAFVLFAIVADGLSFGPRRIVEILVDVVSLEVAIIGIPFYYSVVWPILQYIVWGEFKLFPWWNAR